MSQFLATRGGLYAMSKWLCCVVVMCGRYKTQACLSSPCYKCPVLVAAGEYDRSLNSGRQVTLRFALYGLSERRVGAALVLVIINYLSTVQCPDA